MKKSEHLERHRKLHRGLDELAADWITKTNGMLSQATILDLINWSFDQTQEDTIVHEEK